MKKYFTTLFSAAIISIGLLSSCNKAETYEQLNSQDETAMDDASARHGHYGNGPHHGGGPHHHNPHNNPHNNGCDNNGCPSAVATAQDMTYTLDFSSFEFTKINATVVYSNDGPAGTFRLVLKNDLGVATNSSTVSASHTDPGQTASFNIEFDVPYENWPYTLDIEGRPSQLNCGIRSLQSYPIVRPDL